MKKFLCLVLSLLLLLSMTGCKQGQSNDDPAPTEAPTAPTKPNLSDFGPWVLTAEYEKDTDKLRNYRYDESGALLGFGDYKAIAESNDQGGKTLKFTAYDADGNVSNMLSKLHYVYDADGKLVGYQRYEALGDKLADSFVFEYDSKGHMVKQEKFYMDNWHETITYTYEDDRITAATFKSSVYESGYSYVYDDEGVLCQLDFHTKYVKSGNEDKGSLALLKSVYEDDTTYRVILSTGSGSDGVSQGKEVVRYEVSYNGEGKPLSVTLELKEWGLFQIASMPMRQCGAMNAANWSAGSAKFIYQPLADYVAQ
ncbi:MAG: hypothetical protein IJF65_06685 [Clostridia bacterium]|nr:hypothetical protein [Clostridia bacterium]